jgi:tetratricopeptide (TPR) repeat protein
LLNLLSGVAGLRVIARTSSFAFKARAATIAQIARELDVNHVLEAACAARANGCASRHSSCARPTARTLWSQTYDRNLTDIFAVQDDIAAAVTRELCDRLLPARTSPAGVGREPAATATTRTARHTISTCAAVSYESAHRRRLCPGHRVSRRAVALDPAFAPAWAALGWAGLLQADQGYTDAKRGFADGRAAIQRALELDPALVDAHTALAWIAIAHDWDWSAARLAIGRALATEPSNAHALMVQGVLEYTLARHDAAQRALEASLTRDPLRPITYQFIGRNFTNSGRFAEAEAAFRRELELDPGREAVHYFIARSLLYAGRVDEALREAALEKDPVWSLLGRSLCLYTSGDDAGSRRALDDLSARFADVSAYQVAEAYGCAADDDAFKWLTLHSSSATADSATSSAHPRCAHCSATLDSDTDAAAQASVETENGHEVTALTTGFHPGPAVAPHTEACSVLRGLRASRRCRQRRLLEPRVDRERLVDRQRPIHRPSSTAMLPSRARVSPRTSVRWMAACRLRIVTMRQSSIAFVVDLKRGPLCARTAARPTDPASRRKNVDGQHERRAHRRHCQQPLPRSELGERASSMPSTFCAMYKGNSAP